MNTGDKNIVIVAWGNRYFTTGLGVWEEANMDSTKWKGK
jgi:hypothetical protein